MMRVVVIGTSGSGKTTLARGIAARSLLLHIELDAINWQPGWRDRVRHDPAEFIRLVTETIQNDRWVADGNYGLVRDRVWRRATHLVWLDYERPVIMVRVVTRSLFRVISGIELWSGTGNREQWRHLIRASHPIRWAWRTWSQLRQETADSIERPEYAHLVVLRLRHPREAARAIEMLATAAGQDSVARWRAAER